MFLLLSSIHTYEYVYYHNNHIVQSYFHKCKCEIIIWSISSFDEDSRVPQNCLIYHGNNMYFANAIPLKQDKYSR